MVLKMAGEKPACCVRMDEQAILTIFFIALLTNALQRYNRSWSQPGLNVQVDVEGKHATPDSDKAKAKAAIPDWKSKAKEGGTTHAWQVRLKRKWIKEELHKQRYEL